MITISRVKEIIEKVMCELQDINCIDYTEKERNQAKINKAYDILDSFRDELIREQIKAKQEREEK